MNTSPFHRPVRALCAAIALVSLPFSPSARADDAPRVDALRVTKIATDYLATHGRNAPYIVSVALEKDALLHGETSWIVRFSRPLLADGNAEVGMKVKLDGSVSYLVSDKASARKRAAGGND